MKVFFKFHSVNFQFLPPDWTSEPIRSGSSPGVSRHGLSAFIIPFVLYMRWIFLWYIDSRGIGLSPLQNLHCGPFFSFVSYACTYVVVRVFTTKRFTIYIPNSVCWLLLKFDENLLFQLKAYLCFPTNFNFYNLEVQKIVWLKTDFLTILLFKLVWTS